jgi:hypothetical protein
MLIHPEIQLTSSKCPKETLGRTPTIEKFANDPELFKKFHNCMTGFSNSNLKEVSQL